MSRKIIAIDIETAPTNSEKVISMLAAKIRPPSNYKDEEKIKVYVADKLKSSIRETALNPLFGHIVGIGMTIDGSNISVFNSSPDTYSHPDVELQLIDQAMGRFVDMLKELSVRNFTDFVIAGHNLVAFDLPFIVRRGILLGSKRVASLMRNRFLPQPSVQQPWKLNNVFDTMVAWGKPWPRLKELAYMLGLNLDGVDDLDGGSTLDAFLHGNVDAMVEHMKNDVSISFDVASKLIELGFTM